MRGEAKREERRGDGKGKREERGEKETKKYLYSCGGTSECLKEGTCPFRRWTFVTAAMGGCRQAEFVDLFVVAFFHSLLSFCGFFFFSIHGLALLRCLHSQRSTAL